MIDLSNIDTVLYIDKNSINESDEYLDRMYTTKRPESSYGGVDINRMDPFHYNVAAYGKLIQQGLSSSPGTICEVTDFGRWVVVTAGYTNTITGRVSKKTFLIVFENKGEGRVMVASNKWRSISGAQQAVSYIRSAISMLKNETTKKI